MPIHKFITKPVTVRLQPDSVYWIPKADVKHNPIRQNEGLRWEIFAQENLTIQPGRTFLVTLGLGVRMTRGNCLISLRQNIKQQRCSLQDGTVSEDVDDIIITIQNNSEVAIEIKEGDSLCYVNYML